MPHHNWITQYVTGSKPLSRFDPTLEHWRQLEASLQRWGGASCWKRLEQLGEIAQTNF